MRAAKPFIGQQAAYLLIAGNQPRQVAHRSPDPVDHAILLQLAQQRRYKNLRYVGRDFKTIKIDDLDVRPIRHYLATRVEAHLLICMLAAYLTWHLRKELAPLTFTDENIPRTRRPGNPRPALTPGRGKGRRQGNTRRADPLPVQGPDRPPVDTDPAGHQFQRTDREDHRPPPRSRLRAFDLLGSAIPVRLT